MSLRTFRSLFLLSCLFLSQLLLATEPAYTLIPDEEYRLDRKVFIKKEGRKYGLVNKRGKEVLPAKYDSLLYTELANQYIAYLQNTKGTKAVGIITERDKKIIPIGFQHIQPVALTLYTVTNFEGFAALYDSEGKAKTSFTFDEITAFKGNVARFYKNGKAGLINNQGEILLPAEYKDIIIRSDSTADVINLRNWKILDGNNRQLNDLYFDSIRPLGPDRWATSIKFYNSAGQPTLMSALTNAKDGKQFIAESDDTFDKLFELNEGYLAVEIDRQQGFVDTQGRLRISNRYDSVGAFSNEYAAVKLMGRWGYIDKLERIKIQPLYEEAGPFEEDLAIIKKAGAYGLINKEGKVIIEPAYEKIRSLNGGRFLIVKEGKMGITDKAANTLLTAKYDHIEDLKNGYFLVSRNGKKGLINYQGVSTIPMMYDTLLWDEINEVYLCSERGEAIERKNLR